jgi:hypothetical protein
MVLPNTFSHVNCRQLLQTGANIGIKNWWGELPISRIQPELLGKLINL